MSKLRSKLKTIAKRKSRRETVAKRKVERAQRDQEAKSAAAEEARIEAEVDEIIRAEAEGCDPSDKVIAGLIVRGPAIAESKKKVLSRKQLKRQEKHRERGDATASALEKKWVIKKQRVKFRAQIRNSELSNE